MTLDECRQHIGAGVVYRPNGRAVSEDGVIVRVNDSYVFVRYWGRETPSATRPEDLVLLAARADA